MARCSIILLLMQAFFLLSTVTAQYPFRRAPGVAFGLTPDYGVAAIHLKSGVSVPIARIQGPPTYQAFMRSQRNQTASITTESSTLCRWATPGLNILSSAFGLDIDICRHPDVNSVKALLATLKTAVESYLGTNICYAALNFDHEQISFWGPTYEESVIEEALQSLGVSQVMMGFPKTAKFLIMAREPREYPEDYAPGYGEPEPRTVLAIDYSLNWFNVGLYVIETPWLVDGVELGIHGPITRVNGTNQLDALGDTLNRLFASPPGGFHLPNDIQQLLLYGDDPKNEDLHKILGTLLDEHLVRNANISSSVFDAAMYHAEVVYEILDEFQFNTRVTPPALGCMWRSKLYREQGHIEL